MPFVLRGTSAHDARLEASAASKRTPWASATRPHRRRQHATTANATLVSSTLLMAAAFGAGLPRTAAYHTRHLDSLISGTPDVEACNSDHGSMTYPDAFTLYPSFPTEGGGCYGGHYATGPWLVGGADLAPPMYYSGKSASCPWSVPKRVALLHVGKAAGSTVNATLFAAPVNYTQCAIAHRIGGLAACCSLPIPRHALLALSWTLVCSVLEQSPHVLVGAARPIKV